MSSETERYRTASPSRTVVPSGLPPVEQARAELAAALYAIEEKVNVPKRAARAGRRVVERGRVLARRNPAAAAAAVAGVAVAVGVAAWAITNAVARGLSR